MENDNSIGCLPHDEGTTTQNKSHNAESTAYEGEIRPKNYEVQINPGDLKENTRPKNYKIKRMSSPKQKKDNKKNLIKSWDNDDVGNTKEKEIMNSSDTKAENIRHPVADACENVKSNVSEKISCVDMAKKIREQHNFLRIEGQLFLYDEQGGFWRIIKESEANREIRNIIPLDLRSRVNKSSLYEIYEWLRMLSDEVDDVISERKFYINLADCAYNWKQNFVIEERANLLFKYALSISMREIQNKANGTYAKFIQDVFGDDQKTQKEFRKFLGLCMSDIRFLKICFFLYGLPNSGKTVMLNLLKKIFGKEWCSSLSFSQMSNEFAITQLLGKRLNLSGEVSGASNKRLDIFKSLTGNDTITACFKGKDHFQFRNESILVFACNSFPMISSLEEFDSFLSRIIIFPFFNVKPRNEWIDNLEEALMGDARTIFLDAVKGLRELEEDDYCFIESRAMKECKQSFIGQYNSFALYADEFIEQSTESKITSDDIRKSYMAFCEERGYLAQPDNVWSQYLKQKFMCEAKILEVLKNGQKFRCRGYQGIKLIRKKEI